MRIHATDRLPDVASVAESLALFEDILTGGAMLRMRVTGRSMNPFLRGGEILTIRKVPCNSLKKGDLIFFRSSEGCPVVHRIVWRAPHDSLGITFRTKGDALVIPDEPVGDKEILGKVCIVEYGTKHINMEARRWRAVNYMLAVISLVESRLSFIVRTVKQSAGSGRMSGNVKV